ncbi:hypothetical protein PG997_002706 [Apiospora hydei]|uniref:Uncharacterized protein n=1 Tax=Apiospora hydei TaxID=1337664 RepID=A0ABR1WX59_9PEZI
MGPTQIPEQYLTLIEAGLAVRGGEWFRYEFDTDFFNLALVGEANPRAERALDVYITTTLLKGHYTGEMKASLHRGIKGFSESEESWMIRVWVEARKRLGTNNADLEATSKFGGAQHVASDSFGGLVDIQRRDARPRTPGRTNADAF